MNGFEVRRHRRLADGFRICRMRVTGPGQILGCRVYLELHVRVERDWSRTRKGLRKVGYDPG